jgi:Sulfatase-modifying factor enzyme 1
MHMLHIQPFHTLCALLSGGLLLCAWRGIALAQQLDPTEVTNRDYQEFVLATGRAAPDHWDGPTFPPGAGEEPVTMVTWYDARDYCAWRGKRLPRQDEWQQACQAPDFPKRGNIWEWTQSEEQGWKVLCGPQGTCDCSHRYRPAWKNAVKGFRCAKEQPLAFWPFRRSGPAP